jgi:hypothetical protein
VTDFPEALLKLFTFIRSLLLLISALSLPSLSIAADKGQLSATSRAGLSKPSSAGRNPSALAGPFDFESASVPRNFTGHDCKVLTERLKKLVPEKTEFESHADFDKRSDLSAVTIFTGLLASDLLALVPSHHAWNFEYDAERRQATLSLSKYRIGSYAFTSVKNGHKHLEAVMHSELSSSRREYVGTNGFGVRVNVTERRVTACGIAIANKTRLGDYARVTIPLEPEAARSLKENLGGILIGTVQKPYLAEISRYIEPSIQSPWEYWMKGDAVVIDLKDVWFFNRATGQVLVRIEKRPETAVPSEK